MRDSKLFDKAVETFFGPISRRFNLPFSKVRDGIYDIPSPHFIMRVRLDTGHHRGLNVTLRPASFRDFDEDKPGIQLGIGCFIEFYGKKPQDTLIDVFTDKDFLDRARLLAIAAEHYGVPYLLGKGKDWDAVKEVIRKKTEKDTERIKKYRYPKNVREEWI
jgi:hypothetical protein